MKLQKRYLLYFVLIFTAFGLLSSGAQARPLYQPQVRPLESCEVCHVNKGGGGPMNKFGADWQSNGGRLEGIEDWDTDGDGVANGQELKDKTDPGNPKSNKNQGSPILLYSIGGVVLIGGTMAMFMAAARVRKNQEEAEAEKQDEDS